MFALLVVMTVAVTGVAIINVSIVVLVPAMPGKDSR
jgi:hypothetical protein